jgi:hypothetical protein
MERPDFPPSKEEVLEQLRAVLATPRFTNALKPSAILRLGVERILQGEKTTGKHIAKGVFGKDFDQYVSPDVRVTASNLRKTLKTYYEREGADDLSVFSYPEPQTDKSIRPTEGEAYTPRYAFNPTNDILMLVRLAYVRLEKVTYGDHERAFRIFERLLGEDPESVEANLGMATTLLSFAQWGWVNPADSEPSAACEEIFVKLGGRAANFWRYWATKAFFAQGKEDVKLAEKFYGRSLALNRSSVEDFLPFIWHWSARSFSYQFS